MSSGRFGSRTRFAWLDLAAARRELERLRTALEDVDGLSPTTTEMSARGLQGLYLADEANRLNCSAVELAAVVSETEGVPRFAVDEDGGISYVGVEQRIHERQVQKLIARAELEVRRLVDPDPPRCERCGEPLLARRRGGARYCPPSRRVRCKQRAYRRRAPARI